MTGFIKINETSFQQEVQILTHPVLVEFGAPWCSPCHDLEPILAAPLGEREWAGKVRLIKINADQCPDPFPRFSVMSMPTLIFFSEGKRTVKMTGLQTSANLTRKINSYLSGSPAQV